VSEHFLNGTERVSVSITEACAASEPLGHPKVIDFWDKSGICETTTVST